MERSIGRLDGKVAIVTGAGQGVGLGVARAFGAEGARVVVANRSTDLGEAAAAGIEHDFGDRGARAIHVKSDVSKEASVRDLVERTIGAFGRVDVLINNATPGGRSARLEKTAHSAVEDHIRVNYYAAFWAMQAVFPHMKANGWGRIVNMASLNGINAHAYTLAYNASKEALRALTRTAAVEWGRHGITCNVLCPFADTPAWQGFIKFDPKSAGRIVEDHPIPRAGDPETDIGPVAVFLSCEDSRYVTGNTLHVDGGGHISGVPWKPELPE
jgi:NAD(P)-dependent dehydrogenase (short-subunit alcohol dehydrogenase family)